MDSNAFPRQSPIPCPQWCDPLLCFQDADEVVHGSTPVVLMVGDERWKFDLIQHVEARFPDEPGTVDLRIRSTDTVFTGNDAEHLFPVAAIPALTNRLTIEYHRAKFLGVLAGDAA